VERPASDKVSNHVRPRDASSKVYLKPDDNPSFSHAAIGASKPHMEMSTLEVAEFDEAGNLVSTYIESASGGKSEGRRLDVVVSSPPIGPK
jgi:hypothetical protein